jgi:hypothetical protein
MALPKKLKYLNLFNDGQQLPRPGQRADAAKAHPQAGELSRRRHDRFRLH